MPPRSLDLDGWSLIKRLQEAACRPGRRDRNVPSAESPVNILADLQRRRE